MTTNLGSIVNIFIFILGGIVLSFNEHKYLQFGNDEEICMSSRICMKKVAATSIWMMS